MSHIPRTLFHIEIGYQFENLRHLEQDQRAAAIPPLERPAVEEGLCRRYEDPVLGTWRAMRCCLFWVLFEAWFGLSPETSLTAFTPNIAYGTYHGLP